MSSALHVVCAGSGPRIVFVHGSAADHATWSIQLASALRERFALVTYDRREDATTVEAHADDLAGLVAGAPTPALVVGSSFGAVVVLDLVRRRPAGVAGAVLIEPPMAASDDAVAAPDAFLAPLDQVAATAGPEAAAERFLRMVLGDAAYERMPRAFQARSKARWAQIRADSLALLAYRPRYAALAEVTTPVLLLGGERSAPYFGETLTALDAALPRSRRERVAGAGHMLHAEAYRRFAELVTTFAAELGLS